MQLADSVQIVSFLNFFTYFSSSHWERDVKIYNSDCEFVFNCVFSFNSVRFCFKLFWSSGVRVCICRFFSFLVNWWPFILVILPSLCPLHMHTHNKFYHTFFMFTVCMVYPFNPFTLGLIMSLYLKSTSCKQWTVGLFFFFF